MLDITQAKLSDSQYFQENSIKKQIYLHHTAGNGDAVGVSRYWNRNDSRIATAFIIAESGDIVQCFSSKHWAWHLGIDAEDLARSGARYQNLNKTSVGIEVCNWGYLKKVDGNYITYTGTKVKPENVTTLDGPYKGHLYWYKYTDAQIESLRKLIVYLCDTYQIPNEYREQIWGIDREAFMGTPGIYTHNSVRKDKSDIYPDSRMIKMLQSL